MKLTRQLRAVRALVMLALTAVWSHSSFADLLYKTGTGSNTFLIVNQATNTIVPNAVAGGEAPTAADILVFNRFNMAAASYFVAPTNGANLSLSGLRITDPAGVISILNNTNQNQTLTIGAGGIDLSNATQNLSFGNSTGGTLTIATSAAQTWTVRNLRTLSFDNTPLILNHAVSIGFVGGTLATQGVVDLNTSISGSGSMNITGMNGSSGGVVNIKGNNSGWTGAVTVGGGATLNVDTGTTAGQSRLADAQVLTLNRGTLALTNNTANQTEVVGGLSLGQGLNQILRISTNTGTKLDVNGAITVGMGAGLNVGDIGTSTANSHLITDKLNTNGTLGAAMVAIKTTATADINWVKNATGAADGAVIALSGADYTTQNNLNSWTTPTQNILMTLSGTASTASRTISSLKIAAPVAVTVDIGTGNTLTINDGANAGGIMRNQNTASTIGHATTIGQGTLTAGASDATPDTLYLWNVQNTMTVNNVIANNGAGALHLFSGGAGTVRINADNTYTGGTTIAAGTLTLGNNLASGDAADLGSGAVVNHGLLTIDKTAAASTTLANSISGTGGLTLNRGTLTLTGTNTYSGDTTVSANATLRAGSSGATSSDSRMILNAASATFDLDVFNASIAALSGSNATAVVLLGANTLTLTGSDKARAGANDNTLTGVAQSYQGSISGGGNLVKNGAYTQNLTGTGVLSYTGTTTVNAGVLRTDKAMSTSGVTVSGTGNFVSNVAASLGAAATVNLSAAGSTWTINNGFSQGIASLAGAVDSRVILGAGAGSETLTITDNGGSPATFNGVIAMSSLAGAGTGSLVKDGSNTLVLGGGNSYNGSTTINGGILRIAAGNPVQVIPDRSAVTLANAAGVALDLNGNNERIGSLAGGGALGGNVTLGSGTLTTGGNNGTTIFDGAINAASAAQGAVVKVGAGSMTLTNANSFAALTIRGGGVVLNHGGGNALADTTSVTLTRAGTSLTLMTSETVGTLTGAANSTIALGANTLTAGGGTNTLVASNITGTGGLTKTGASTMTLAGNNTYSGPTTINQGIVTLGAATTANNSLLRLHNVISDSSAVVMAAGTTLNVGPNVNTNAATFERIGSLSSPTATATVNLLNGSNLGALVIGGDNSSTTFRGNITGNNGGTAVMKIGSGTFTYESQAGDTYDGVMRVENGTLRTNTANGLDSNGQVVLNNLTGATYQVSVSDTISNISGGGRVVGLPPNALVSNAGTASIGGNLIGDSGGRIVIDSGATLGLGGGNPNPNISPRIFGGVIEGAGNLSKANAYAQELWGANTYTGTTTVSAGTLRWGIYGGATGLGAVTTGGQGSLASATSVIVTGGVLDLNGATQSVTSLGTAATASSGGTIQLLNGSLTVTNQATQSNGTVFTGTLASVVNVNGAGTLTLTGNHANFLGTINVGAGQGLTLNRTGGDTLANAVMVNLASGSTLTVQTADVIGSLSGGGNVTLTSGLTLREARSGAVSAAGYSGTMSGASSLTVGEAGVGLGGFRISGNQSYTGGTTVHPGSTLHLDYSTGGTTNIIPNTGALTLAGARLFVWGGLGNTDNAASTTLNSGATYVGPSFGGGSTALVNLASVTRNAGSTLQVAGSAAALANGNTNGILGGWAVHGQFGFPTTWAVGNGAATAISGLPEASYTANTWAANNHTDVTSSSTQSGTTGDLRFNTAGNNTVTLSAAGTITTGGILVTPNVGGGTSTITGAAGALASGAGNELIVHQHNALGDLVLTNVGGTNTIITKAGQGRLIITNNIAGSGTTHIGEGILQLGNGGAAGMIGTGAITNNAILAVNRSDSPSIGGVISGVGEVWQTGTGTLTLSGANTYAGRTVINSGTLTVTNASGLGAGFATQARGANLTSVHGTGILDINIGGAISELIHLDGGTRRVRSVSATTFTGPLVLSSTSTVNLGAGAAVGHVQSGAVLGLPGAALNVTGVASGSTMIFTGTNQFSELNVGANANVMFGNNTATGSLPAGTISVAASGSLSFNRNNGVLKVANTIVGAGALSLGAATLGSNTATAGRVIFTGENAYAGPVLIRRGALEIGGETFGGTISTTAVSSAIGTAGQLISVGDNSASSNGADAILRFNNLRDLIEVASDVKLTPNTTGAAGNGRAAFLVKNSVGTVDVTGRVGGIDVNGTGSGSTATGASGIIQVNSGVLRLSGGLADTTLAAGSTFTGELQLNGGYLEIFGTSNNTIGTGGASGVGGYLSGGAALVHNSTGTLTLQGVNQMTGTLGLLIYEGTVAANYTTPTPAPIAHSGTSNSGQAILNLASTAGLRVGMTLTGTGVGGFTITQIINSTQVRLSSNLTAAGAGNYTVATQGALRDDGFVTVAPGATLRIDAAETVGMMGGYKGGSLVLNANFTTGRSTHSGINVGGFNTALVTGTGNFIKDGSGGTGFNYSLLNPNNSFNGNLEITHGLVILGSLKDAGVNSAAGSGSTIQIGSSIANSVLTGIDYRGGATTTNRTFALTNGVAGTGANVQRTISANGNGEIKLTGPVTYTGANNSTLFVRGANTVQETDFSYTFAQAYAPGSPPAAYRTTLLNGINTISGNITQSGGGNLSLSKDDGGWWFLTGANTFAGSTIAVNNGQLYASTVTGATSALGNMTGTKTMGIGSGGTTATFVYTGTGETLPASITVTPTGTTGGAVIANIGTGPLTIQTMGTPGAGAKTLTLGRFDDSAGFVNVLSGNIVNNSGTNTTAVTKNGLSTWRVSGNNTNTGNWTINEGVLQVANGSAIENNRTVNVANAFGRGATLEVLNSETIGALQGGIGSTTSIAGGAVLAVQAGNTTFNGVITGSGGFTRTDSDNVNARVTTLPNKNTYDGVTSILTAGSNNRANRLDVYHLADGLQPSSIGDSSSAAGNLIIATGTGNGSLRWVGFQDQSTDRLFTLGAGVSGSTTFANGLQADGSIIGTNVPSISFTGTGAILYTAANQPSVFNLRGDTRSNNVFNPQLLNNGSGVVSLTKSGATTWVLGGNNAFSGAVTISGGTLALTHNNALGTTANGVIINSSTRSFLDLRGVTIAGEALTINGGNFAGLAATVGTNTWAGGITLNTDNVVHYIDVASGASLNISGVIGSGGTGRELTKVGLGSLSLSNINTYTGITNVRGGEIVLDQSVNTGSRLADGAALRLGGNTNIGTAGPGFANNDAAIYAHGGTIRLAGAPGTAHEEIVASTTLEAGANRIVRDAGANGTIRLNAISRGTGATLNLGAASIASADTGNSSGILGGWATLNGLNWAINSTGGGDGPITALASYTNNGLGAGVNSNVTTAGIAVAADDNVHTLRFNDGTGASTVNVAAGATLTVDTGGILVTSNVGANTARIDGASGFLTAGTTAQAANDLIINQYNTARAFQIDLPIVQNGASNVGLVLSGGGDLLLAADNTRRGNTFINEGTVYLGSTNLAVPGAAGTLGDGAIAGAYTGTILLNGALVFNTSHTDTWIAAGGISGDGVLRLAQGNTRTIQLTADNGSFQGDIFVDGGTLEIGLNNNALGNNRGITTIGNGGVLQFIDSRSTAEHITMNQGSTVRIQSAATGAVLSGKQTLTNSNSGGVVYDVEPGALLTISGLIETNNGFTKNGGGRLTLSATNFTGVVDGFTSATINPSLLGQIQVNAGELFVGNARALGGFGLGNETIVASGAAIDIRNNGLNNGDDPASMREVFVIEGSGINGTGALRSTVATGTVSHVVLNGDATIGSIYRVTDFASGRVDLNVFDSNTTPGVSYTAPSFDGNGYNLTKVGTGDLVFHEVNFTNMGTYSGSTASSAIGVLRVAEGEVRIETNSPFPYSNLSSSTLTGGQPVSPTSATAGALTTANVGSIVVDYAGPTQGNDGNGNILSGAANLSPNFSARLEFYRQHNVVHTVPITLGTGYIELRSDTIPKTYTYLDGTVTLTGASNGTLSFFNVQGGGFSTATNNAVVGTITPWGTSGVNPGGVMLLTGNGGAGTAITGSGGFTKIGDRELRILAPTDYTGDTLVMRDVATGVPIGEAGQTRAEMFSMTLAGNGTISNSANIILERQGVLRVDNTGYLDPSNNGIAGGNNNNRIGDSTNIRYHSGWLVFDNQAANTEALGDIFVESGRNFLSVNLTDGSNNNTTLTIDSLSRTAGATLAVTSWDATSTFGTGTAGDSMKVLLTDNGAALGTFLTGAATGATDKKVITGVVGGISPLVNYLQSHVSATGDYPFRTIDVISQARNILYNTGRDLMTVDAGVLRPLDDSEYSGTLSAGQNVNLQDVHQSLRSSLSINSLRFGNLSDNQGDNGGGLVPDSRLLNLQDTNTALTLDDHVTLQIASGMIVSSNFGMGTNQDMTSRIRGGTLDFGAQEGVIINNNLFFRLAEGVFAGNNLEIGSTITGSGGITKAGTQLVVFDGRNTYSGRTTISDGTLYLRNSMGLGAGGVGNGVVIDGNGSMMLATGINVGSVLGNPDINALGPQDILVRQTVADGQTALRADGQVNRYLGDLIVDNVDSAGLSNHLESFTGNLLLNRYRVRYTVNNNATLIHEGDIFGGSTPITNDLTITGSRYVSTDASGNGYILMKGQFGDRSVAGEAAAVANPVSQSPSSGTVTNVNELLRFYVGLNDELNVNVYQPWDAVGRIELMRGFLRYHGDPLDVTSGGDFYTLDARSKIPVANNFSQAGFQIGGSIIDNSAGDNSITAFLLTQGGQSFKLTNWTLTGNANNNNGIVIIGGENEAGTVVFGDASQNSTITLGRSVRLYANDGGTVQFDARLNGNVPIVKSGRGTVVLNGSAVGAANASNLMIAGGDLQLNFTTNNNVFVTANSTLNLAGGAMVVTGSPTAPTTQGIATGANDNALNIRTGGTEVVVRTTANQNTTLNLGRFVSTSDGAVINRTLGGTVNFVEDQAAGGTARITLNTKTQPTYFYNTLLPWATYGTTARQAIDFATADGGTGGDMRPFDRALDEYENNIAVWPTIGSGLDGLDVAENGGTGFYGTLSGSTVVNSILFNAPADSNIQLGANDLTVNSGGIMVASTVGASNKSISGTGFISPNFITQKGTATSGSAVLTGLDTTVGLYVGMPVTGAGIPANTAVQTIDSASQITLNNSATAAGTPALVFGSQEMIIHHYGAGDLLISAPFGGPSVSQSGTNTSGSATVTVADTSVLSLGMGIAGTGIPAGSTIIDIVDAFTVVISNNATSGGSGRTFTFAPAVNLTVTGPSTTNASTIGTTGAVVLTSTAGGFTGTVQISGGVLSVSNEAQLGVINVENSTQNAIYMNGGTFRWTGPTAALDPERGWRFGGNGGVVDVTEGGTVLTIQAAIDSENTNVFINGNAAGNTSVGSGDLIKVGAGTLALRGTNSNFQGMIDVREGTLRATTGSTGAAGTIATFGTNRSYIDGTIFRTGTDFEIYMSNGNGTGDWAFEEWFRFEGDNVIRAGDPATAANARPIQFNGVIDLAGDVVVDTSSQTTLRFNIGGGYLTGTGDIVKMGQGTLEFRENNVEWSGSLTILEGTVRGLAQGRPFGVSTAPITLGSTEHQGIANLEMLPENALSGTYYELFQDVDVTYNPLQAKRITLNSPQGVNDVNTYFHGDITLNDNLTLYIADNSIPAGGKYSYAYFNGDFKDGATTSGNLVLHMDETASGTANERTNGTVRGFFVFNGNNAAWTGDLTLGLNTATDRDEIAVLRLGTDTALTAVNDVTMNQNSVLQLGGRTVSIGSLFVGASASQIADGSSGPNIVIENAAATNGALTINQTTPVNTEVVWNATFQDGNLPSHFFLDGTAGAGSLALVKNGGGWATLAQDNHYTGGTTVAGGILQVGRNNIGDTGADTGAGGVLVQAGATLAGTGVVRGDATIDALANLMPGDEAGRTMGTLTFAGDATLSDDSITTLQVQRASYNNSGYIGYDAGPSYDNWINGIPTDLFSATLSDPLLTTQHDAVNVMGTLNWTTGTKVVVANNGYMPSAGDIFDLFDWFNVVGSINVGAAIRTGAEAGTDLDLFELGGDYRWDTSLFNTQGILVVTLPGIVPEPGRALLILMALLGMFWRRRRGVTSW